MHQSIRNNLEEYLKDHRSEVPAEFHRHLGGCPECRSELGRLEEQSGLLRSLKTQEAEPRAGFYARVMERIEAQKQFSIWSVFLQRKFGFRLAVASGMLAALLGVYLVASESGAPETFASPAVTVQSTIQPSLAQQRDALLVDLASYRQ
jgi:anti-sigma factor RsiW